ncbi:acyl-CoA/acyl-ACP dehydrogenase [Novosphingobium sp. G106]|uniref:acyl-CoA dehydrogenase family protein n=1 Tax=Novosphingobium sp. G106 TaxID=2849500 RepID=UPI001C2D50A8|nr:acyl-CoA dehydrogenase family protein [Novosphingobium sp. G106]MBV1687513.1 acyl-CoA/acyl-ACP dehydrogenase [Novosphingobium sp. G106]
MIERAELHDAAQKAFPADQLRPDRKASWDLIAEMGWLLLPLPEDAGGLGLGRDAAAAIHFELGKVLSTAPLLTALLTVQALAAADDLPDQAGWIERLTAGELVTVNLLPADLELTDSGSIRLSGTLPCTLDADLASHTLVVTGDLAVLVPLDGEGVALAERRLWDESRRLFDVTLTNHTVAPELVVARGAKVQTLVAHLESNLQLALAADSLGGATAALDMTVEYLKTRKQFDRPLAMFQSLKHRCADLKVQVSAAEALLWKRAADENASSVDFGALKARASDVYRIVAEEAIQLHGGIGLTEEHPINLFMKRAMLNLQLGGSLDTWRELAGRQALEQYAA